MSAKARASIWLVSLLLAGCSRPQPAPLPAAEPIRAARPVGQPPAARVPGSAPAPQAAKALPPQEPPPDGGDPTNRPGNDHPYGTWVPVEPSKAGTGIWGMRLNMDGGLVMYPGLDEENVTGRVRLRRLEGRLTNALTFSSGRTAYDLTLILEQLENPDRANLYMPKDYDQGRRVAALMQGGRGRAPEGSMNVSEMIRIVDPGIPREARLGDQLASISMELREARALERQIGQRQAALAAGPASREALAELGGNRTELRAIQARSAQLARARSELEAALRASARRRSVVGLDDESFVRVERLLVELEATRQPRDALGIFEGREALRESAPHRPGKAAKPW